MAPAEELRQELAPEEEFELKGLHLGEVMGQIWYNCGMTLSKHSHILTNEAGVDTN